MIRTSQMQKLLCDDLKGYPAALLLGTGGHE